MSREMRTPYPPARVRFRHGALALELRPSHPSHAPDLVAAYEASAPELKAFMVWAHTPQTIEGQYARLVQLQAAYWRGDEYLFDLYDPADGACVGCVGLHRRAMSSKALEIGYWIRSDRAGRGLCTLAARAAAALAFEHFGCVRLQCGYNAANGASARVAEKVGFTPEARLLRFEEPPTQAMIEDGLRLAPELVLSVLFPETARTLPWWDEVIAGLEIVPPW